MPVCLFSVKFADTARASQIDAGGAVSAETAEFKQHVVAGKSPDDEQNVVEEMKQYHESGGDGFVSRQCDESYRYDTEFQAVFRNLTYNAQFAGLAQMQYHTIIISAENVAKGVE
jgi:hypothetical protein